MSGQISFQVASATLEHPPASEFNLWIQTALKHEECSGDLAVYLVDREEMTALNKSYRGKDGTTNVLSFPADLPAGVPIPLLGDIVLCAPVVAQEAAAQSKSAMDHWAHLTIHGTLHLLGYDHQDDAEAGEMESREVAILAELGIANPYH